MQEYIVFVSPLIREMMSKIEISPKFIILFILFYHFPALTKPNNYSLNLYASPPWLSPGMYMLYI